MNILSDFRSCSLAGSDSPDWFVGDNCVLEGIDAVYIDNSLELFFAYCVGFTLFELFQAFTDAQNRNQTCSLDCLELVGNNFISFIVVCSSFAVTNDCVFAAEFFNHYRRVFTGKSTAVVNICIF